MAADYNNIGWFLLGSVYTLALLLAGLTLGYFYGAKEHKIAERKATITRRLAKLHRRGDAGGSVPKKTLAQAEEEERAPFKPRFAQIIGQRSEDQAAQPSGEEPRGLIDI